MTTGTWEAGARPWQRLQWAGLDASARARTLERPARSRSPAVASAVEAIFSRVRTGGDDALRALTAELDGVDITTLEVTEGEGRDALASLEPTLLAALAEARDRIEAFHRAGVAPDYEIETAPGVRCRRILRPIQCVGLYVPAGSAPLVSTALMLAVPARLAGCPQVILCTPPQPGGRVDPNVLAAARLCGVERVFALGGAQAIAAMALGTQTVPAVGKIFGPGGPYVDEAKRQALQAGVAIDLPAGPSEVLVIADAGANPAFVAADLLSQAEHGPDSQVLLLSDSNDLLDAVEAALEAQLTTLPRKGVAAQALASARLIRVPAIGDAFTLSNRYAPEHLILALREPEAWLSHVQAAGSVFLGDWTPEALGDYCSGTNHVLPTHGAARAWSGLSVASFQTAISVQAASPEGLAGIGPCAVTLARAEGLDAHARAVSLRLEALAP